MQHAPTPIKQTAAFQIPASSSAFRIIIPHLYHFHLAREFHQSRNPAATNCVFLLKNNHPTPNIATLKKMILLLHSKPKIKNGCFPSSWFPNGSLSAPRLCPRLPRSPSSFSVHAMPPFIIYHLAFIVVASASALPPFSIYRLSFIVALLSSVPRRLGGEMKC
jgi:hypothetical protein